MASNYVYVILYPVRIYQIFIHIFLAVAKSMVRMAVNK